MGSTSAMTWSNPSRSTGGAFARSCQPDRRRQGFPACPDVAGTSRILERSLESLDLSRTCRSVPRTTPCSRRPPRCGQLQHSGAPPCDENRDGAAREAVEALRPKAGIAAFEGHTFAAQQRDDDLQRFGKTADAVARGEAEGLVLRATPAGAEPQHEGRPRPRRALLPSSRSPRIPEGTAEHERAQFDARRHRRNCGE